MRAHLRLELKTLTGEIVKTVEAYNSVMKSGAELVTRLFAGKTNIAITHMGVGTRDQPETEAYDTTELSNDAIGDEAPLQGATEVAIPPDAFSEPEIDEVRRVAVVRLRATLPADAAIGTVREAGLLARDGANAMLYNRVTFSPIAKGDDHELTLFWEVSFPYGDLQWLM